MIQLNFKFVAISMALMCISLGNGGAQIQANDGVYVVVNHIPKECKVKIDGYYEASKDGAVSLPILKATIPSVGNKNEVREDLVKAIARFCHQEFPGRAVFPDCEIVAGANGKVEAAGVTVVGQARNPGSVPMKEGLTVYQAVSDAGGPTAFATMRHVTILRERKVIDLDLTKVEFMKVPLKSGDIVIVPRKCVASESEYSLR